VVGAALAPARIDGRGVPVPATGDTAARIQRKWAGLVGCTGLATGPS
jgi:poly-gamma-glutamate synthesis protein (capsule biosynthesis protein)